MPARRPATRQRPGAGSPPERSTRKSRKSPPLQQRQRTIVKRGRAQGTVAKNKGRKHDTDVRLAAWLTWQRRCGDFQLPKGVAAVKSKAALPLLKDIARTLDVPGGRRLDNQVSWLRLWLGRKIADPELAKMGSPGRGKGTRALGYCYASTLYYHRVCLRIAL